MGLNREKKSLGYAIQEVKADELTKAGSASLTSSLFYQNGCTDYRFTVIARGHRSGHLHCLSQYHAYTYKEEKHYVLLDYKYMLNADE